MKATPLLILLFLLFCGSAYAQAPTRFNYQGIARTATGAPLASKLLGLRISIRNGSATGSILYQETQSTLTNPYGLYNIAIGGGTVTSGSMTGISWATGTKYIQVEIDPQGGTSYTDLGASQLLSVPYSLYSANTGSVNLSLTGNSLSAGGNSVTLPLGTTYTAGTGISLSGTVINALPSSALWNANEIQGFGVSTNTPSTGQALIWSGSAWVPNNLVANTSISGTANYVTKYATAGSLGTSQIQDDGTSVGIGLSSLVSSNLFQVNTGNSNAIVGTVTGTGTAVSGTVSGTSGGIAGLFDAGTNGKSLIIPNGRVGIGTSTPTMPLEVKTSRRYGVFGYSDSSMGSTGVYDADRFPAGLRGEYRGLGLNEGSGVLGVCVTPNATLGIGVTGIGNFTGILGIGTDSSMAAVYAYSHGATFGMYTQGYGGSTAALMVQQSMATYGIYSNGLSYFNGNIQGSGTNSYSSDRKLKKDIQPIPAALGILAQLRPSSYQFRTHEFGSMYLPEGKHYGLIAQELQDVLPELVIQHHFQPESKKEPAFDYLGINYNELIPIMIKGIQEQQAIIDQQNMKLELLEQRLEALEKKLGGK